MNLDEAVTQLAMSVIERKGADSTGATVMSEACFSRRMTPLVRVHRYLVCSALRIRAERNFLWLVNRCRVACRNSEIPKGSEFTSR